MHLFHGLNHKISSLWTTFVMFYINYLYIYIYMLSYVVYETFISTRFARIYVYIIVVYVKTKIRPVTWNEMQNIRTKNVLEYVYVYIKCMLIFKRRR